MTFDEEERAYVEQALASLAGDWPNEFGLSQFKKLVTFTMAQRHLARLDERRSRATIETVDAKFTAISKAAQAFLEKASVDNRVALRRALNAEPKAKP